MYQQAHSLAVIYPLETGEWLFAAITGHQVVHFGPFESRDEADEILSAMYPDMPAVELPEQARKLDSDGVTILGYAAVQQVAFQEETGR
ncbi:hypothetical protein [Cupriavidus sp. YAF13]|uniref:hypothetical protein n=1 Tax=Cupriavidus sp. YAF13 TaxID=3233075 RepID=UPI003F8F9E77